MNQIPVIIERLSESFLINCKLFTLTLLFSLPLGLLIAFGSMSRFRPIRWLVRTFVWTIRGTPLMLQPLLFSTDQVFWKCIFLAKWFVRTFVAAVVAFVINYACYFSQRFIEAALKTCRGSI